MGGLGTGRGDFSCFSKHPRLRHHPVPSSKVLSAPEPLCWAQLSCETLQMVLELGANRVTKQLAQVLPSSHDGAWPS